MDWSRCSTTSRSRKRIAAKPRKKLRTSRQKFVRIGRLTLVAITTRGRTDELTMAKRKSKGAYMISSVAEMYEIHPQTLRLYEREGLLKPSRTDGNTRLYTDED